MRWVKISLVALLVILTLLVASAIPLLNRAFVHYEEEIIARLQQRYPQFSLGALQLDWQGVNPVISAQDFNSSFAFSASTIRVPIKLWQSLSQQQLVSAGIDIVEPQLSLKLDATGDALGNDWRQWQSLLASIGDFGWQQATLSLELAETNLSLSSSGSFSYTGQQIVIRGDLTNDQQQRAQWRVQSTLPASGELAAAPVNVYLSSSGWNLPAELLNSLQPVELNASKWSGELWLDYQLTEGVNSLRVNNNFLQLSTAESSMLIQGGAGGWDAKQQSFNFDNWQHPDYPLLRSKLLLNQEAGLNLSLQQVALRPWLEFLASDYPQISYLTAVRTDAVVQDLRLRWQADNIKAQAQLSAIELQSGELNPGWDRLEANISADIALGTDSLSYQIDAHLSSAETNLSWPRLLTSDLNLEQLSGQVRLRGNSYSWNLQLQDFSFANAGAELNLSLSDAGLLQMQASLQPQDLQSAYRFIPYALLDDPGWDQWLRSNVVSAQLDSARLNLQHDFNSADQDSNSLDLRLEASDVRGRFAPEWSAIELPTAQINIDYAGAHLRAPEVHSSGLTFTAVDLRARDQQLNTRALLDADIAEQLAWLQQSPLAEQIPAALLATNPQGPLLTVLNFQVDLDAGAISEQNSIIAMQGLSFDLPAQLQAEQVRGELQVNKDGWAFDQLSGLLNGNPVQIVAAEPGLSGASKYRISGELNPASLLPQLAALVSGSSSFAASLSLENNSTDLALSSDTVGISINLPPPLGKQAADSSELRLSLSIAPDYQLGQLQFQGVDSAWIVAPERSPGLALAYQAQLPPVAAGTVGINVNIEQLDLQRWALPLGMLALSDPGSGSEWPLPTLNVNIDKLNYGRLSLQELQLSNQAPGVYRLDSNRFNGDINISDVWTIDLERLQLPSFANEAGAESDYLTAWNLAALLPDFDLKVEELYHKQKLRGALQAQARALGASEYQISPVLLLNPELNMSAGYRQQITGDNTQNFFSLEANGSNINPLLDNLSSETAYLRSELNWEGGLSAEAIKSGNGSVYTNFQDGVISGDRPNAIIGFLGVISIDNILKRLKLDFSDVSAEGTSFSRLEANMTMSNGKLVTAQPLVLISNAGNLSMSGSVDFPGNYLDQRLSVTLPLSKSLPVAAIIAGAPQLAPAFWLTDRLAEHALNRFTSASYTVRGDLAEPEIVLERLLNETVK